MLEQLIDYLIDKLPLLLEFCIHLLIAFTLWVVGKRIVKAILSFLRKSFERSKMEDGVAAFLLSIIKFALYFLLLIIICQFLGFETSSVIALLGSAGLAVGLALQGSLANFAGGVLILVMKPFMVGDYIIVDGLEGTVISIDIIYTKLQMIDNKTVIMPNGKLADSNITNVTREDKRRIDLVIAVDYSENIKKVRSVLSQVIESEPDILREEPIDIVVGDLNRSSVDMIVHVWVNKEDYWSVRWDMLEKIKEKFDEEQIVIPYDQLDVTLKKD